AAMVRASPEDAATSIPRRAAGPVTAWPNADRGVVGRQAARWRAPLVMTVTYCLSYVADEVSCRVRVGDHPARPLGRASPLGAGLDRPPLPGSPAPADGRSQRDLGRRQGWAPSESSSLEGVTNEWDSTRARRQLSRSGYDGVAQVVRLTPVERQDPRDSAVSQASTKRCRVTSAGTSRSSSAPSARSE